MSDLRALNRPSTTTEWIGSICIIANRSTRRARSVLGARAIHMVLATPAHCRRHLSNLPACADKIRQCRPLFVLSGPLMFVLSFLRADYG